MRDNENYWKRLRRRPVSRRGFLVGSGVAAAGGAAILAGCGDDDDDDTPTAAPQATQATQAAGSDATATAAPTEAPAAEDRSRYGGTFNYQNSLGAAPRGYDPAVTITYPFGLAQTYHQLMAYSLEQNTFYPDGATSWEQVDPETLVLNLREGVRFNPEAAGGRPVTADDWAYSIRRYPNARQNLGSNVNQIFYDWMVNIEDGEFRDGMEVVNDSTLRINQLKILGSNLQTLAAASVVAVAPEEVEANGGDLQNKPNGGAGPYMFDEVGDTRLTLKRNPNYYQHPEQVSGTRFNVDMPYINAWEDQIVPDLAARESRFLAGDADHFGAIDKFKAEEWEGQPNVQILEGAGIDDGSSMIQLAAAKWAPYPELSKALSLAMDWDGYIEIILGGEGRRGAPVSPVAFPHYGLSQEEIRDLQQYDPQQARQLWEANGGPDIFPELNTTTAAWASSEHVTFIGSSFEQSLGVTVNYNPRDVATFIASANGRTGLKDWDFFVAGNNALATSPDWNALVGYAPDGYGAIWGGNWYKGSLIAQPFEDPSHPNYEGDTDDGRTVLEALEVTHPYAREIQDAVNEQAAAATNEERADLLRALQRRIFTRFCCTFPLPVASISRIATGARVRNMPAPPDGEQTAAFGFLRAQNIWLDNA